MTFTHRTINIQGEDQEAFEVYADESKEQTIAFVFDAELAHFIAARKELLKCAEILAELSDDCVKNEAGGPQWCNHCIAEQAIAKAEGRE